MTTTEHSSWGVPLESYVLTKINHRWQKDSEDTQEWAKRTVDELLQQRLANLGPERFAEAEAELADRVRERISARKTPDHQLMRWRLRLYCGHIVEGRRHASLGVPTLHGSSAECCKVCGKDPSVIVAYEPIALVAQPPNAHAPAVPEPKRKTRAQLEREIAGLQAENARLRQNHRSPSS